MDAANDPSTGEGCAFGVAAAQRDERWHFRLRQLDFPAAGQFREAHIRNFVVGETHHHLLASAAPRGAGTARSGEVYLETVSWGEELPFLQAGAGVLGPAVLVLRRDAEPEIAAGVSDPGLFMGLSSAMSSSPSAARARTAARVRAAGVWL